MKRLLLVLFLMTASLLGSCQCSDKPDVPPIDDDRRAQSMESSAPHQ